MFQANKDISQKNLILNHLRAGRSITPLEALGEYSVYRLAPVIHRLKGDGYHIETTIKRSMRQRPYAEYTLKEV